MNNKVRGLLNEQIAKEFESGYLYLNMAAMCEARGLKGIAHWYRVQAEEEKEHAMIIFNYLLDEGEKVELGTLYMPDHSCSTLKEIFTEALQHEQYITETINNIYDAAEDEGDYRTMRFLDWFITEQAEEERNAKDNLDLLSLAGNCNCVLMEIDERLGERK